MDFYELIPKCNSIQDTCDLTWTKMTCHLQFKTKLYNCNQNISEFFFCYNHDYKVVMRMHIFSTTTVKISWQTFAD